MGADGKLAMVTGANGHLGNNLIRVLLDRGYRVRASVRDASEPAKSDMLPKTGIELVSLDVRDAGRFAAVSRGVDTLFHAAGTYKYHTGSAQADEQMIGDCVEGTAAALYAASSNSIGRVVLTSSAVTLPMVAAGGRPTTEDDWRTDLRMPYFRAKVEAERQAWRIAGEKGVNLVAVLPGAMIGPGFSRTTPSTDAIQAIMLGGMRMGAPDSNFPAVDVRDVVAAHILAAESGKGGRFVVVNDELPSFLALTSIVNRLDPSVPAARRTLPDAVLGLAPFLDWLNHNTLGTPRLLTRELIASVKGKQWTMSSARAKHELGWQQTIALERSVADTMAVLRGIGRRRAAGAGPG